MTNKPEVKKDEEKKEDVNVKVPKRLIDQMMKELEELKEDRAKEKEDKKEKDPVPTNNVRLRKYEGGIVIGFNKERGTWKKYDKDRREDRLMMEITVAYDDDEKNKVFTVDYNNFMEDALEVEVPLIKITSEEVVKELGYISVKEVIDYKSVDTPNKVMQKVISSKDTVLVKMPNGKELALDIDFINL